MVSMVSRIGLLLPLVVTAALGAGAAIARDSSAPAVIELFTSQGCSSCPSADTLIGELSKDQPNLIALTLPVDYWDYIGWKDTLALPAFTARQRAYASLRGDHQIYTPQAVINGLSHVVGSDRDEIKTSAKIAFGRDGALSVGLSAQPEEGGLAVELGAAPQGAARTGELWLFHIARERTVSIGRGENAGARVTYANVVRHMQKIGDWAGSPVRFAIPRDDLSAPDSDSYVLILQAGSMEKPGPILAATAGDHIR